jgi:hypothetical protein
LVPLAIIKDASDNTNRKWKKTMNFEKLKKIIQESEFVFLLIISVISTLGAAVEKITSFINHPYIFYILTLFAILTFLRLGFATKKIKTNIYPIQEKTIPKYGKKTTFISRILLSFCILSLIGVFLYDTLSISPQQRQKLNDLIIQGNFYVNRSDWENAGMMFENALKIDCKNQNALNGLKIVTEHLK